ncbi:hypothetical protein WN944_028815 [Citrus x changshan-huyou]|uniref:Uncharacterized protein n=1 Tax=Citrus x changshan-huyou TaxID=2935761 RepID=A0AAP0QEA0_9ROSI
MGVLRKLEHSNGDLVPNSFLRISFSGHCLRAICLHFIERRSQIRRAVVGTGADYWAALYDSGSAATFL